MVLKGFGQAGDVQVTLSATIDDVGLRDDANQRVANLLTREAQRIAEISFVDKRDAAAEPAELERIRKAPANRSHVVVAAGSREAVEKGQMKAEDTVQVLKGSVKVGNKTLQSRQ